MSLLSSFTNKISKIRKAVKGVVPAPIFKIADKVIRSTPIGAGVMTGLDFASGLSSLGGKSIKSLSGGIGNFGLGELPSLEGLRINLSDRADFLGVQKALLSKHFDKSKKGMQQQKQYMNKLEIQMAKNASVAASAVMGQASELLKTLRNKRDAALAVTLTPVEMVYAPEDPIVASAFNLIVGPTAHDKSFQMNAAYDTIMRGFFTGARTFEITDLVQAIQKFHEYEQQCTNPLEFFEFFGYKSDGTIVMSVWSDDPNSFVTISTEDLRNDPSFKPLLKWFLVTSKNESILDKYIPVFNDFFGDKVDKYHPILIKLLASAVMMRYGIDLFRYMGVSTLDAFTDRMLFDITPGKFVPFDDILRQISVRCAQTFGRWESDLQAYSSATNATDRTNRLAALKLRGFKLFSQFSLYEIGEDVAVLRSSGMTENDWSNITDFCKNRYTDLAILVELTNDSTKYAQDMNDDEICDALVEATMDNVGAEVWSDDDLIAYDDFKDTIDHVRKEIVKVTSWSLDGAKRIHTQVIKFFEEWNIFVSKNEIDIIARTYVDDAIRSVRDQINNELRKLMSLPAEPHDTQQGE